MIQQRSVHKHGRAAAMFFLLMALALVAKAKEALPLEFNFWRETWLDRGTLQKEYWQAVTPQSDSPAVNGLFDQGIQLRWQLTQQWSAFVEQRHIATIASNEASLSIAAKEKFNSSAFPLGRYSLLANQSDHQFNAVGVQFKYPLPQGYLALKTKWVILKHVKEVDGNGILSKTGDLANLSGSIEMDSEHSKGFFAQPRAADLGQGSSLDLEWQQTLGLDTFNIKVLNALSHIRADNLFYTRDQYQVNAVNGEILFSQTPSLVSHYGQRAFNINLPRVINTSYNHRWSQSAWSTSVGLIKLPHGQIPWGQLQHSWGNWWAHVNTLAFNNIGLGIGSKDMAVTGLDIDLQWTQASQRYGQVTMVSVAYRF